MLLPLLAMTAAATPWVRVNPVPTAASIHGFWGTSSTEVWAYGDGALLRWDGREWSRADVWIPEFASCCAMSGRPGAVTVVGTRFRPETRTGCLTEPPLWQTWTARWDGRAWSLTEHEVEGEAAIAAASAPPVRVATTISEASLQRLWTEHRPLGDRVPARVRDGHRIGVEVWAVGEEPASLVRFDGREWHVDTNVTDGTIASPFFTGDVGFASALEPVTPALLRWDGVAWQREPVAEPITSLWGASPDDLWAASADGDVRHWDGAAWSEPHALKTLGGARIWGRASDDVWVGGCGDSVHHWDGSTWRQTPTPIGATHSGVCPAIWGAASDDVWAAAHRSAWHWDGERWLEAPPIIRDGSVQALWGTAADDLWAASGVYVMGRGEYQPQLHHWDGIAWTGVAVPEASGMPLAMWGRSADDVFVVGAAGLILHWDGVAWSVEPSGTRETLFGVHGTAEAAWAVGTGGTLLRASIDAGATPPGDTRHP